MLNIKLIVLCFWIKANFKCFANYCEICPNHTICKYTAEGPSIACKSYDNTGLLKKLDVDDIVNKINERRNFVAMGLSNNYPQAANMRKIRWSKELAMFAQRWVDQCDPSMRPDKEDQCRDLADTKVGQNIATILGPSPGLNVKSFVEMWFIQTLDYVGSVSYYNQSRDYKTRYLTQLIWAETNTVGCGKARFNVNNNNVTERLVCNFAPKGNNHGRPVYAIGLTATQCPADMISDDKFKGLCEYQTRKNLIKTSTYKSSTMISLLRILNLANNSAKYEIDPIRNNLKQIRRRINGTNDQRNQKTRHIFMNHSNDARKYLSPLQQQTFWNNPISISYNHGSIHHQQQEKGHSRVYHGQAQENYASQFIENTDQDFRRHEYTTIALNPYSNQDIRKQNQNQHCTRKASTCDTRTTSPCTTNECTRGLQIHYQKPFPSPIIDHVLPHELCPCNTQTITTCSTSPTSCTCNCQYPKINYPITPCIKILRRQNDITKNATKKFDGFNYYDLFPEIAIPIERLKTKKATYSSTKTNSRFLDTTQNVIGFKPEIASFKKREYGKHDKEVKDINDCSKSVELEHGYLYSCFDSSKRKKRELEDQSIRPFWQMKEFNHKKPSQLKAMRYTTLSNFKKKMIRSTISPKEPISTEFITIEMIESANRHSAHHHPITEKYLSFDELMHLRKFSADYDGRRKGATTKATTKTTAKATAKTIAKTTAKITTKTTSTKTTEITTNTPFVRKKHCTRKMTCTWTSATITGSGGEVIMHNGGGRNQGSRTPPGYVEGCTRTSTCTRDFMERNKMAYLTSDTSTELTPEDEDYCERRSLNVRSQNFNKGKVIQSNVEQVTHTNIPTTTYYISFESEKSTKNPDELVSQTDCICYEENPRLKRDYNDKNWSFIIFDDNTNNLYHTPHFIKNDKGSHVLSYVDLYYLVLRNIIKTWEKKRNLFRPGQCSCNSGFGIQNCKLKFLIIFFIWIKLCQVSDKL